MTRDQCLWEVDEAEITCQMWIHYEQTTGKQVPWTPSILDRVSQIIDQKMRALSDGKDS